VQDRVYARKLPVLTELKQRISMNGTRLRSPRRDKQKISYLVRTRQEIFACPFGG